jgi:rhodanese-related sulfurtransferase
MFSPFCCLPGLAESSILLEAAGSDSPPIKEKPMSSLEQLLAEARLRGDNESLPYAGAVTPQEAYALLQASPNVKMIDVRTQAERDWIGRVIVPDAQHLAIQWTLYPGGAQNPEFMKQLEQQARLGDTLLFLCRSGVRSRYAAKLATEHGFEHCFDILEGFEGDRNEKGHRKSIGGWCSHGLPWVGA